MGLVCSGPWGQICCRALGLTLRICLVWVILGRMEKIKKKIWEKIVGRSIWLEGEDGEKIEHQSPPKINLPKSRRKQRRKFAFFVQNLKSLFCPLVHSHSKSNAWLFNIILFFSPFFLTTTNLPELILIKKKKTRINVFFFFPYKGSVPDPPKNRHQHRCYVGF